MQASALGGHRVAQRLVGAHADPITAARRVDQDTLALLVDRQVLEGLGLEDDGRLLRGVGRAPDGGQQERGHHETAGAKKHAAAYGERAADATPRPPNRHEDDHAEEAREPSRRSPAPVVTLHADVFVAAHDRPALERLCRYMARPPIPQDRLAWREDGMLVLSLKRTRRGARGRSSRVRAIVFTPQALIARLAALVPAPYMHLRRFYGIFAPHHKLRARIFPTPPDPATSDTPVAPKRPKSMTWADLLMPRNCVPETRAVDALRCPHCLDGGAGAPAAGDHLCGPRS